MLTYRQWIANNFSQILTYRSSRPECGYYHNSVRRIPRFDPAQPDKIQDKTVIPLFNTQRVYGPLQTLTTPTSERTLRLATHREFKCNTPGQLCCQKIPDRGCQQKKVNMENNFESAAKI